MMGDDDSDNCDDYMESDPCYPSYNYHHCL